MRIHEGRYFPTNQDIEPIEWIVERLMKNKDFDILTAYSLAVEIQRNQMIQAALYLTDDGDGPILIQVANEFTGIRKHIETLSNAMHGVAHAIERLKDDDA